ncbi:MSCRAMM family protein [Hyalangium minutum]|nr:carboxypeptidase-like regulatory domain-containing protein [Hyalangium minutum]
MWLLLPVRPGSEASAPTSSSATDSPARTARSRMRLSAPAARTSTEALVELRGLVLGAQGPVAGAQVLISEVVPGESLSTLPCGGFRDRTLLDCLYGEYEAEILQLVKERRGEAIVRAETRSAADGSFSLSGLEPGSYAVWVESAEGVAFRPSVLAGAEPVELRLGPARWVSGLVTDDANVPVAGALVTAIFSSHSRFFETLTDAQGRYQLGPLPPGVLVALAAKEGLLSSAEPLWTYTPDVKRTFVLTQPKQLTGRVLRAKLPVPGVEVQLTHDLGVEEPRTAVTDAAGRFSFDGLSPEFYTVLAEQEGEGDSTTIHLGEEPSSPEITLELKPVVFIEGKVRGEDQQPLPDAEVSAYWDDVEREGEEKTEEEGAEQGEGQESPGPLLATTDEAGHYRLGPMPPGWYQLSARTRTHQQVIEESRPYTQRVTAQDFTLKRASLVEGQLVDTQGHPVEGEYVSLRSFADGSAWDHAQTDAEGRFSLSAALPDDYELKVEGERVKMQTLNVTVPTKPLRIVGETLLHVVGEVVDETGMPLPNAEVAIWPEQAAPKDRPIDLDDTDGEGRFSLKLPSAGRYTVMAELFSRNFLRTATQTVAVEPGGEARVRLRFDEGRSFTGKAVDWRGQPLPDIPVLLLPVPRQVLSRGGHMPDLSIKTDVEGRFTLVQVSGEEFDACIRGSAYVPLPAVHGPARCIRVKNDGQEARLVLGREVFVTGRLVHPDGSPVTHFRVNGREISREDGEISLLIHQPGQERIELSAPGLQPVLRTAPEFPEGVSIQDLGTLVMSP